MNLCKLHTTLQSLTDKEAKLMTNIREGLTLPGLTNWYGLCNLFTYICYTYIWHLVHAILLVVLRNVVQSIANHCILDQLTRASLHVSSSTPHLKSCFKLVQSSFSDAVWANVFMLQSKDRGNASQTDESTQN